MKNNMYLMDPTICDVYKFFLYGYSATFTRNMNYFHSFEMGINTLQYSINDSVIENSDELGKFLEKYWIFK